MDGSQFFVPDPRLAEVVDALWDVDVTDAEQARAATIKVLPVTPKCRGWSKCWRKPKMRANG
jgi:hypothetical protein